MDALEFSRVPESDPFFSAYLKTKWAYQHIGHIKNAVFDSYFVTRGDAYEVLTDFKTGETHEVEKLRRVAGVREDILIYASYALYDLRSALDHVACAISAGRNRHAAEFLIAESAAEFDRIGKKRVEAGRLCETSLFFMRAFEPYMGGAGDLLYALHRLNILDKHRMLMCVGLYKHTRPIEDDSPVNFRTATWAPFEKDDNIVRAPVDESYAHTKSLVNIAFDNVQSIEYEPVETVLGDMTTLAEKIIYMARRLFPGASAPPAI